MARLNEPPVSTDSLETRKYSHASPPNHPDTTLTASHDAVRKKLLRQNRDLAKSNNVRALRIRELENDCACILSENLELRSRILELERELEDNDTRRIADHALAIKEKLESQLTEWGTLLAGLGLEPPMKRHSPQIRRTAKPRLSFSSARPSPSQRRLRDIARDIEELGHISETKSHPRMSMKYVIILDRGNKLNANNFQALNRFWLSDPRQIPLTLQSLARLPCLNSSMKTPLKSIPPVDPIPHLPKRVPRPRWSHQSPSSLPAVSRWWKDPPHL